MLIEVGLWIAGALSLALGALSISQWNRIPEARFFVMTVLGSSVWAFGISIFLTTSHEEILIASASAYYLAAALIAYATFLLGYTAYKQAAPKQSFVAVTSIPLLAWAACFAVVPEVFLTNVYVADQNTADLNLVTYSWYIVYFLVYFVSGSTLLFRSIARTRARQRDRMRYLCWGYSIAGVIGVIFNLISPAFGNYQLIWIGPLGLLLFAPIVYVAIIRFGLFDVRQTLARTLAYVGTLATLAGIYVVTLTAISSWLLPDEVTSVQYNVNVIIMLCLVFAFQPIKQLFDSVTNQIFYRHQYRRENFYRQVNAALTKTTELRKLLNSISTLLATTLKAKSVTIMIYRGNDVVSSGRSRRSLIPLKDLKWLDNQVSSTQTLLIDRNEVILGGNDELARFLRLYGAQMVLPLKQVDGVLGYILFDEHQSGKYARRDHEVLETIANELVIAIQNALSVEEIRELNDTLQQRINEATKELRHSNAQLRKLDEAKDEFISMASHQLRTPLTSIKGYVDMILEGDAGDITPMQRKFLTEAFVSSERMVHLINDFLNVSRLQTGTFAIDKRPVDLAKIVGQELDSLKISAGGRDLSFRYNKPTEFPTLLLDEGKIRQVIMNFADNALYYSRPGTKIEVSLETEDDAVVLKVKDTGIGVPEEEQAQLFTKFYRASNARKQRPDGTGVGLYLAKRVIMEHGGSVIFSSVEGEGSTFGFRLPLGRLRARDDADQLDNQPHDH